MFNTHNGTDVPQNFARFPSQSSLNKGIFCRSQIFYNYQTIPFLILQNAYPFSINDGLSSYSAARVIY